MPRLIVIARPRSGSTAVMELLGSHPEIQNFGELLNPIDCDLPTNEEEIYKYLDDKLSQRPAGWPRPWNAFKIHAYQKDEQNFRWDNLMHYCGIEAAIVVWRKEVVESIVSAKIANLTGEWYSNKECNTITSVNISKDYLEWRIQEDFKNWSDLFEQWPIEMRPIFIQYEDLFYSNDNKTIPERFQTVFEQVGIDRCDYINCYAKRQNPAPLKEKIQNWSELPNELLEQKIDVPSLFEHVISKRFRLPRELVTTVVPEREPRPPREGFKYRVSDPYLPKEVFENVNDALNTGNISSASSWPKKLSAMLCKFFEMPVAIPCNTGFTSLVLTLQAANISRNDEVIVPTFTMIAVPNSVLFMGAKPVFVDIEEGEYNPSWRQIEALITTKTKAIIIAHTYGSPAKDIELISDECQKRGLILIEDISEAVGISTRVTNRPKLLGTFGDFACASMYVNKMLHGGDGGFVLSRNPAIAARLQSLVNHGFTRSYHFIHFESAINGKINGLGAAVACGVLDNFTYVVEHRAKISKWFRKYLRTIVPDKIKLMPLCGVGDTPWIFGIHCQSKKVRTKLRGFLAQKGIETRDYFFPMHLQPAFRKNDESLQRLYNSEKLGSIGFYLPTHPNLKKEDVKFFAESILEYFGYGIETQELLDSSEKNCSYAKNGIPIEYNKLKVYESKETFDLKQLYKKALICFEGEEKWDDKRELIDQIDSYNSNPIAKFGDKESKLSQFRKYFQSTMDIEKVSHDFTEFGTYLPELIVDKEINQIVYVRTSKASNSSLSLIQKHAKLYEIHIEEVKIPENGYSMSFQGKTIDPNTLMLINLENVTSHQVEKLIGFYQDVDIECKTLILIGANDKFLTLLTSFAEKYVLKEKHQDTRIYELKPKPVDISLDWEEIQTLWNTPLPRKMKFVDEPDWNHHHKNAYKQSIDLLKEKYHDDNAEVLFISAVEQYMCDCEVTPKQPWVGVVHGIPKNEDHFYVPDLEKLCTKSRFKPWFQRCIGLFTLTTAQKEYLKKNLPYNFPITQLFYPSVNLDSKFNPTSTALQKLKNGEDVHAYFIGSYDRNFEHFFNAKFFSRIKKVLLECDMETSFIHIPNDIIFAKRATDEEYEKILQHNLVFLALKNGGAANTLIIECIMRNVPIIAPRVGSVIDYIGKDYPLLYEPEMLDFTEFINETSIEAAVKYLKNMDKTFLKQEKFVEDVERSPILAYMRPFSKKTNKFDVTISLCSYKRTHNLEAILDSLINHQTFQGKYEIIIWNNNNSRQRKVEQIVEKFQASLKNDSCKRLELITSSENHFCAVRFAMTQFMLSDKLLICDDDIIPGSQYIEFFVKNHYKNPNDVLCLRGNYFLPHKMPTNDPHKIWTDYDAFRFADDSEEECSIHYVHADACLIPKSALHEVASTETPDTSYMLVDDYWMSYVLSAKFDRNLRKLKLVNDVLTRTTDSDQIGVALYTSKEVANAKTRMYLHHMSHGWPNFEDKEPYTNNELKQLKSSSWNKHRIGFNINSEISHEEISELVKLGVNIVRIGIVGAGRDEGFEFSEFVNQPKNALDEMETLIKRLDENSIDAVVVLDGRIANEKNWGLISERLCKYSNVVGYDLFNEPFTKQNETQHWYEIRKGGVEMETEGFLNLHKNLVKAIRKNDAVTPIIVETLFWANIATLKHLCIDDLKEIDDNLIASIHYYLPQTLTWRAQNNGRFMFPGHVPIFEKVSNSETIYWSPDFIEKEFKEVSEWMNKHGIRVFVGEFGIARDVNGASLYINSIAQACQKYGIPACLYAYRDPDWETMDYELSCDPRNYRIRSTGNDNPLYKVLTLGKIQVDTSLSSNEVLVKWLASPINPLDINKIEGHYPVPPDFPIIGGSEVIGEVERVGPDVKSLKPGDAVVSLGMTQTCWSEYAVIDETLLLKIDKRIDLVSAATLLINPPTAYVMLKEYVDLNPGDFIIQNASNSGVGRSVIQLAKAFGLKSINLIRNRPNVQDLKNELHQLGADYVFTEEEFRANSRTFLKSLDTPIRLALNGVGGKSCLAISNALGSGGTLVTYGGMGRQPHEISTSGFVFKNIKAEGIAITLWLNQESQENVQKMFDHLQKLILEGRLKPPPVEFHEMENFSEAINRTLDGKHGKQMLLLHPDYKIRARL